MADDQFNFDSVREALAREIKRSGIAPTNLSLRVSPSNKSLVKNILEGSSDIKLSTLCKLADELEINVAQLIPWAETASAEPEPLSADLLEPLLDAILPLAPASGRMTDPVRRALASSLAYGLELLGSSATSRASGDAVAVAARASVSRFREIMH